MKKEEIKTLVIFLRNNNVYDSYRYYINHHEIYCKGTTRRRCISTPHFFTQINAYQAIHCAFYWISTKEGDAFWAKISNEYQNFLKEKGISDETLFKKRFEDD